MRRTRTAQKGILFLVFLTTITIFIWIGVEVYRTLERTSVPEVIKEQLEPLDPKLNDKVLESLEQRTTFSQEQLSQVPEITKFETTTGGETATPAGEVE